ERKGQVRHQKAGQRYVYQPLLEPAKARRSALDRLVHTFFGGSAARAATSLLGRSAESMSDQELAELEAIVRQARQRNEPQSAEAGDRGPGAEEADASAAARGPSSGGER
ncbi:MAG: BlaI/MecI/CopY family transcriptional regulator, partial [Holophagales bacterium]|nr:BlaI/MecI/CopY family transcriptional regulator [Holophagales bacterium]